MYKYIIEEFFKGCWLFSRAYDDLELAYKYINVMHEKHSDKRYRLIEVIKDV